MLKLFKVCFSCQILIKNNNVNKNYKLVLKSRKKIYKYIYILLINTLSPYRVIINNLYTRINP